MYSLYSICDSKMNSVVNLLPFLVFFSSFFLSFSQPNFWFYSCGKLGNYTESSTFSTNLKTFLSSIISETHSDVDNSRFYNLTVGKKTGDDLVSGEAWCRGDVAPADCHTCYTDAAGEIRQVCPNQKEAIGWYRDCIMRYANRQIINTLTTSPKFSVANPLSSTDPVVFNRQLKVLLRSLQGKIVDEKLLKFASGSAKVNGSESVYAVLQCTHDLNASSCSKCVDALIDYVPICCYGKIGGAILIPNCATRFDVSQFFHLADTSRSPSTLNSKGNSRWELSHLTIPITLFTFATILLVGIYICRRMWKSMRMANKEIEQMIVADALQFDLNTIKLATHNFSADNKLGQGGFGEVYKGKLVNGQDIAVKRLSTDSCQGILEFKTEVVLVAKLQHKNLVKLLGFCLASKEKILVYEFLSNSSLDRFIFGKNISLDWKMRFKIMLGIARGLLYLHEDSRLKFIHRDLKTSNILLDESMNPKISDFGLAKLFVVDQTQGATKRIVGTYGYMAPEYAMTGHFSVKSDVFSFGVIVLEMVSGQRNNTDGPLAKEALLHRAWRLWNMDKVVEFIDPGLENRYELAEIIKCVHIGLLSIQEDPARRPVMTSVVAVLNGDSINFPMPESPQFMRAAMSPISEALATRNAYSILESITEVYAR